MLLQSGVVRGGGALKHHGDLRGDGERRAESAPGAHFLLHGEDEGAVHGQLLFQQLYQYRAAHPVVDGLGLEHAAAKLHHIAGKDAAVAQLHQLLGLLLVRRPDVNVVIRQGRDLFALLRRGHVDGLQPDDAGHLVGAHHHLLAQQDPAVNTAHAGEFQISLVGDVTDNEAHLVHVGAQHQLVSGGFGTLFEHDEVTHGVYPEAVRAGGHPISDIVPHLILKRGYAGKGAQRL